ncbi:UNVERIFIED_CONTAM: hypothetical protein HDU68_011089 [Siphonaria sp. JEL0065]|nr:hypothetical protein HDU68_011089 [Siphonaria sp. JEL0065]
MLSTLFGVAIMKHVNNTDKSWDSYSKLSYILSCDVRGSFLDTAAQLVKLFLQIATWLPGSQTIFGSHVCDFIKVLSAHWFVNDVVKGMGDGSSGVGQSTIKKGRGQNSKNEVVSKGGQANILASCRRKGSFGTKVAQYFKGSQSGGDEKEVPSPVVSSTDTLRFATPSLDSLTVARQQAGGLRQSAKSTESLRTPIIASGSSPGLRGTRSSDNVTMFPKREGQQL